MDNILDTYIIKGEGTSVQVVVHMISADEKYQYKVNIFNAKTPPALHYECEMYPCMTIKATNILPLRSFDPSDNSVLDSFLIIEVNNNPFTYLCVIPDRLAEYKTKHRLIKFESIDGCKWAIDTAGNSHLLPCCIIIHNYHGRCALINDDT